MENDHLRQAEQELDQRPFVALDYIISAAGQGQSEDRQKTLDYFAKAVLRSVKRDELYIPKRPSCVFSQSLSQQQQRFICIALLRLLSTDAKYFLAEFKIQAFGLFDKVFVKDLYPQLGIDERQQTFEKESKLKDTVPHIESELKTVCSSLHTLDAFSSFRQSFMHKFNSSLSRALVFPFLPKHLVDVRLGELFTVVEEYKDETGSNLLQAFEKANSAFTNYWIEAEEYGTRYSKDFLGGLATTLVHALNKHFRSNPISKPAKLLIEKSEKKYPFDVKDNIVNLGFVIRNEGPGHAFDVYFSVDELTDASASKPGHYLGNIALSPVVLEIPAKLIKATSSVMASVAVEWTNFDKSRGNSEFVFELECQRAGVLTGQR